MAVLWGHQEDHPPDHPSKPPRRAVPGEGEEGVSEPAFLTMRRIDFVRKIGTGLPGCPLYTTLPGPHLPGSPLLCEICQKHGFVGAHDPIEEEVCAICDDVYYDGCDTYHHHSHDYDCFDADPIVDLACGCKAHRECEEDNDPCLEHGR
jgi:hypothetical protein